MAYTETNFRTKKSVKDAIKNGKMIRVFSPGPFNSLIPANGTVPLEGPHFPDAHNWYGEGTLEDGVLVRIK